jgi:hypothetical protein
LPLKLASVEVYIHYKQPLLCVSPTQINLCGRAAVTYAKVDPKMLMMSFGGNGPAVKPARSGCYRQSRRAGARPLARRTTGAASNTAVRNKMARLR